MNLAILLADQSGQGPCGRPVPRKVNLSTFPIFKKGIVSHFADYEEIDDMIVRSNEEELSWSSAVNG